MVNLEDSVAATGSKGRELEGFRGVGFRVSEFLGLECEVWSSRFGALVSVL